MDVSKAAELFEPIITSPNPLFCYLASLNYLFLVQADFESDMTSSILSSAFESEDERTLKTALYLLTFCAEHLIEGVDYQGHMEKCLALLDSPIALEASGAIGSMVEMFASELDVFGFVMNLVEIANRPIVVNLIAVLVKFCLDPQPLYQIFFDFAIRTEHPDDSICYLFIELMKVAKTVPEGIVQPLFDLFIGLGTGPGLKAIGHLAACLKGSFETFLAASLNAIQSCLVNREDELQAAVYAFLLILTSCNAGQLLSELVPTFLEMLADGSAAFELQLLAFRVCWVGIVMYRTVVEPFLSDVCSFVRSACEMVEDLEDEEAEESLLLVLFACVEGVLDNFGFEVCWREFGECVWAILKGLARIELNARDTAYVVHLVEVLVRQATDAGVEVPAEFGPHEL
jgi:hypothetical protein